jgi:hypothetical protein
MGRSEIRRRESRVHLAGLLTVWTSATALPLRPHLQVSLLWTRHRPRPQCESEHFETGATVSGFGLEAPGLSRGELSLTLLLFPSDCRTFFRNNRPSAIPGMLRHSRNDTTANTDRVPCMSTTMVFDGSRAITCDNAGNSLVSASASRVVRTSVSTSWRLAGNPLSSSRRPANVSSSFLAPGATRRRQDPSRLGAGHQSPRCRPQRALACSSPRWRGWPKRWRAARRPPPGGNGCAAMSSPAY